MTIKSIKEAVDFLYSFIDYERIIAKEKPALSLESFAKLLEHFDNPHKKFKSIHIAGTKGKGSVTAFLSNIFFKSGLKTGMFISPHIYKINERIRTNNNDIPDEDFVRIINKIKIFLDLNKEKPRLSYRTTFELLTLCAFLYFSESNLDIAVIETGMGGRFDTTNVVTPLVSIITTIGIDHTFYLGDTIEQIAREKAGIIKNNVPVIVSPQDKNIENLLKEIAQEKSAPCYLVSEFTQLIGRKTSRNKQIVSCKVFEKIYNDIEIPLIGTHQCTNILTVLTAIEILKQNIFKSPLDNVCSPHFSGKVKVRSPHFNGKFSHLLKQVLQTNSIKEGIKTTQWEGRIEILQSSAPSPYPPAPIFIVDGAHCPLSAKALSETIQEVFNPKRITLILGVLQDKDLDAIIKNFIVEGIDYKFIAVPVDTPRGMKADKVTEIAKKYFTEIYQCENIKDAITKALEITNKNALIIAFGSIYNIAPIKKSFNE